jgi:hypothetical protein
MLNASQKTITGYKTGCEQESDRGIMNKKSIQVQEHLPAGRQEGKNRDKSY